MIIYGPDRDSFQYKEMDEETMQVFKELIAKIDEYNEKSTRSGDASSLRLALEQSRDNNKETLKLVEANVAEIERLNKRITELEDEVIYLRQYRRAATSCQECYLDGFEDGLHTNKAFLELQKRYSIIEQGLATIKSYFKQNKIKSTTDVSSINLRKIHKDILEIISDVNKNLQGGGGAKNER